MHALPLVLTGFVATALGWADDTLVRVRFENGDEAVITGEVRLVEDVVLYGGIGESNRRSAGFNGDAAASVNFGEAKKVTSTDFTVEAFVKLSRGWVYQAIAGDWSEAEDDRCWALVVTPQRGLRFDISPDGAFHAGNKLETPPGLLACETWYHVAAVSDGNVSRIYINGHCVAERVREKSGIFSEDKARLKVGNVDGYADGRPKPLFGQLDEVRITGRPLAASDFVRTREPMPAPSGPTPDRFAMPFEAKTKEEAVAWQERARARLFELVEAQEPRSSLQDVPLDVRLGDRQDQGEYSLASLTFQGNTLGGRFPAKLCIPEGAGPFPAMLCLHGHGGSAEKVMDPAECYHAFADRFARGGYVVLAPSFPHRKYAAMTLWDLFRCVEILLQRPEVDSTRMGVGGLSMGGEWTMLLAACDPRLRVAVVSGWMCTTEGVFSVPNCSCWELPGFVELMDVSEVNLLIAPRHVVFESAERDGCFPVEHTKRGFARIQAGYALFGASNAAIHDVFPGVHEWHGKVAYPLVDRVLGGHAAAK